MKSVSFLREGQDLSYKGRIYKDKALRDAIEKDINILLSSILGTNWKLSIEKGEFDPYVYCKESMRGFCPVGNKLPLVGHLTDGDSGYCFFARSRVGILLKVLDFFLDSKSVFPMV